MSRSESHLHGLYGRDTGSDSLSVFESESLPASVLIINDPMHAAGPTPRSKSLLHLAALAD